MVKGHEQSSHSRGCTDDKYDVQVRKDAHCYCACA